MELYFQQSKYLCEYSLASFTKALTQEWSVKISTLKKGFLLELFILYCSHMIEETVETNRMRDFWILCNNICALNISMRALWMACLRLQKKHITSKKSIDMCFGDKLHTFRKNNTVFGDLLEEYGTEKIIEETTRQSKLKDPLNTQEIIDGVEIEWKEEESIIAQITDLIEGNKISVTAYKQLHSISKEKIPSYSDIDREIKERSNLAPLTKITSIINSTQTIQFSKASIEEKASLIAEYLLQNNYLEKVNGKIRIKISGDGFLMHKKGWLFFTLTFVDTPSPHKQYSNWLLCLADCSENNPAVFYIAQELEKELEVVRKTGLDVFGEKIPVQSFFSSDQKFLSFILGLKGPTTKRFCCWCDITRTDAQDETKNGAKRDVLILKSGDYVDQVRKGILFTDSMDEIIPDILHLGMRCTEKLIQQLYVNLQTVSNEQQLIDLFLFNFKRITNQPNFKFVLKKTYIKKPNLAGDQVDRILKNIEGLLFQTKGETNEQFAKKKNLVILHKFIFEKLQETTLTDEEREELPIKINKWASLWFLIFPKSFSNSCHVLWKHIPDYIKNNISLTSFSQQGVEALVKYVKKIGNNTFKSNPEISKTIMQKDARRVVRLESELKEKGKLVCRFCGKQGHQRRSSKECQKTFYLKKQKN